MATWPRRPILRSMSSIFWASRGERRGGSSRGVAGMLLACAARFLSPSFEGLRPAADVDLRRSTHRRDRGDRAGARVRGKHLCILDSTPFGVPGCELARSLAVSSTMGTRVPLRACVVFRRGSRGAIVRSGLTSWLCMPVCGILRPPFVNGSCRPVSFRPQAIYAAWLGKRRMSRLRERGERRLLKCALFETRG